MGKYSIYVEGRRWGPPVRFWEGRGHFWGPPGGPYLRCDWLAWGTQSASSKCYWLLSLRAGFPVGPSGVERGLDMPFVVSIEVLSAYYWYFVAYAYGSRGP